ncbi:MAG: transporter [Planctomycetes bacterium]|nr:transporter [Planctomycetota bacterium]
MLRPVFAVAALAVAAPAQLLTTDAGVLSPALIAARETFEWQHRAGADDLRATTRAAWSPNRRLQFEAGLPWIARDVATAAAQGSMTGFGDLEFGAKWALVRDDAVMRSERLSVLGNVRLPTGDDDGRVDGKDLGRRAALGLGVYGFGAGVGWTTVRDRHRAAAALRGWTYTEDGGFAPGEAITFDAAWWMRLHPVRFEPGVHRNELRSVVELISGWQQDDRQGGVGQDNGGFYAKALVGLQANATAATSIEAGVLLPLVDNTESAYGDFHVGVLVTFRVLF